MSSGSWLNPDNVPNDYTLILYGDTHVGATTCDEKALETLMRRGKGRSSTRFIHMGDLVEGVHPGHKHYDHEAVTYHTVGDQYERAIQLLEIAANNHFGFLAGNHDWRHDATWNFARNHVAQQLSIPYLGSRCYAHLAGLNVFLAHVGPRLPKGAKDPRQRTANQQAALQRNVEAAWDSAHLMAYGHTHTTAVAPPIPPTKRYASRPGHPPEFIDVPRHAMTSTHDGYVLTDPWSRYYANTGTFRVQGVLQDATNDHGLHVTGDYAAKYHHQPMPAGYVEFRVKNGEIRTAKEVFP